MKFLSGSGLCSFLICNHMRDRGKKFQSVDEALKHQYLFDCQRRARNSSQRGCIS